MIKLGSKVSIHYKLSVEGALVDSSEDREPLTYTQGSEEMFAEVEKHLEGMNVGDETELSIPPEKGYGPHDPEAVHIVPRNAFDNPEVIKVGMAVQGQGEQGNSFNAIVAEVSTDAITLDFNHPLAGKILDFEFKVVGVS
jgi:FKBP-type peptidyl-prolyl cis-trans isomerase SlyD